MSADVEAVEAYYISDEVEVMWKNSKQQNVQYLINIIARYLSFVTTCCLAPRNLLTARVRLEIS